MMKFSPMGAHLHIPRRTMMAAIPRDVRIPPLTRPYQLIGGGQLLRIGIVRPKVVIRLEPRYRMTDRDDEFNVRKVSDVIPQCEFGLQFFGTFQSVFDPPSVVGVALRLLDGIVSVDDLVRTVPVHGADLAVIQVRFVVFGEIIHEEGRAAFREVHHGEVQQPRYVLGDLRALHQRRQGRQRIGETHILTNRKIALFFVVGGGIVVGDVLVLVVHVLLLGRLRLMRLRL
mmetsp:Transcript_30202/g.89890  ORF Transcript_30202/g.89890 Transcript_30202/m.89890 type:complete len:229 (+) Transcript_30202:731-1417(+)